ncbi:hypothetical protein [Litorivita sp. NS0012-18]|uniref:hypothetical protein n=1 Tax=Litorivita sp. NS0012-18 TaxID=3127655 RepID=UPI0033410086
MRQSSFPSLSALTGALTGRLGRRATEAQNDEPSLEAGSAEFDGADLVLENMDGSHSFAQAAPQRDPAIEADAALLDSLRAKIDEGRPLTAAGGDETGRITPRRARRAAERDAQAQQDAETRQHAVQDTAEAPMQPPTPAQDAAQTAPLSGTLDLSGFAVAEQPAPTAAQCSVSALMTSDADTMVFTASEDRFAAPLVQAVEEQADEDHAAGDLPADDVSEAEVSAEDTPASTAAAPHAAPDDDGHEDQDDDLLLGRCAALAARAAQVNADAAQPQSAELPLPAIDEVPETPTPSALCLHHGAGIGDPDDIIEGFSAEDEVLLIELTEGRRVPRISFRQHPSGDYTDLVLLQDGVIPARRVIRVLGDHSLSRADLAFSIARRMAA